MTPFAHLHHPLIAAAMVVLLCASAAGALASEEPPAETPNVFVVEPQHLSGNDMPKIEFENDPERIHYQKRLFQGEDLSIFILSSGTRLNVQENFPLDEFIYYLNGRADVETGAHQLTFLAGDYIFAPKGWTGTWFNKGGPDLNFELSVISTKRAESSAEHGPSHPVLLDRLALSGIKSHSTDQLPHLVTLQAGAELVIEVQEDLSGVKVLNALSADELYHVLRGQVTVQARGHNARTLSFGDFFLLPKGFEGMMTMTALNRVRLLRITANPDL